MSKRTKAIRRRRYYIQRNICEVCGSPHATPCYLPEPPRLEICSERCVVKERAPDEVLCFAHAPARGYCYSCGDFWGGVSSFEFLHRGLCDNCYDEMRSDVEEFEDEEDFESVFDDDLP